MASPNLDEMQTTTLRNRGPKKVTKTKPTNSVKRNQGFLRMSGHPQAHRIGQRKK